MNRKYRISQVFSVVIATMLVSMGLRAQDNGNALIPVSPDVKIGKLANGLTYYIKKNSRPEKKVELRLVVNAGSILEDDDQQGLAHFTEHMAFNGSKNFKKNDIVSFLQSIGVEFGADLNAYTGFDETVYILPIPTEKKENVEKAFQILEDWAGTVSFDAADIDQERGVVLEEERLGKGAEDRMFRVTYPKMFDGSKYAQRLPIGKADVIKNFRAETIKRFYADWYRPNLMAVVVVGDFDPVEAEALIKKHFSGLKNPAKPKTRYASPVPARVKSEGIVVTDKEATNHVVEIYYPYQKASPDTTLADFRKYLVEILCRSMLSQRMQELTQKADPPFVFGGSNLGGWARGYEAYSSYGYVGKGGPEVAIHALIQENERARKFGFTASELERTRKILTRNIDRAYNERDKTESSTLTQEFISHFLEREPIPGIENEYKYYHDFLPGITLEEVNRMSASMIPPATAPRLAVLTGPENASFTIPTNEQLLAMTEQAAALEVTAYVDKALASSLMEKKPQAGKILTERLMKETEVTELTLQNGIRIYLKPTDFKNDQVVMTGSRFGGQYLSDVADRYNAEYASTIVAQMGVGQFSPLDLRKVLAGKTASVSTRIGGISESMSGQSSAADVESMLQLAHLYFTAPREDHELFASFISKQTSLYQNMTADPEYTFQDSVFNILFKSHPWAPRLPKAESFQKIDMSRALAIYRERFSNANGFNFVITGKFNIDEIKPLLEQYLGSLPSSDVKSSFRDVGLRPVKGVVKKEIRKGTEPKSMIRMMWNGEAVYSDKEQLRVQALAELMNIKITETLREDLSGIYGGGMYGNLSRNPYQSYSMGVSLPCGPENVQKLITATHQEIEKIKKAGPIEADLNKVKETWRQQYLVNIKDNSFWARQMLQVLEAGKSDFSPILDFEKRVAALTTDDLKAAAIKYLDMKNYVEIILNPEN